jgi:hypothetical protein
LKRADEIRRTRLPHCSGCGALMEKVGRAGYCGDCTAAVDTTRAASLAARLEEQLPDAPTVDEVIARHQLAAATQRRRPNARRAGYLADLARVQLALAQADLRRAGDTAAVVDELRALARRIEEGT